MPKPRNVKIPEILIKRLGDYGKRLLKVEKPNKDIMNSGKAAFEKGFQNILYEASDKELQDWLALGGNYGICAGKGMCYVETDSDEVNDKLAYKKTFTTRSGSGRGLHRLYTTNIQQNGVLIDKDGNNLGNIQVHNKYVVGPDSLHWSGGRYEIVDDSKIEWITKEELEEIFGDLLSWAGDKRKEIEEYAKEENKWNISIADKNLLDISKLKAMGNGEYQGAHPIHGSETGQNFAINPKKNLWHCYRCNTGGGPIMWIAVMKGIIKCHEAKKGALTRGKFPRTLAEAEKLGFEIVERIELSPDVERFFDTNKQGNARFRPAYLATELMEENTYVTRKEDKMMFRYDPETGAYQPFGEEHIEWQMIKKLGKHTNINRQTEVINYIKVSTYTHIKPTPTHLIAVKNGLYNMKTGKLDKFDPKHFILNALDVTYDTKAKCPKFMKFVNEVVQKGDIDTIQEVFGYTFQRDYRFQKALLCLGGGQNGKSTLLEVLRTLLGDKNVSNQSLQNLITKTFSVAQLYGKLANIYADIPNTTLVDTGKFKMLTGNDTLSGEHKFKPIFNFRNYAFLIFSCNALPKTKDKSNAFYRRLILINFTREFKDLDPKTDKNLLEKLVTPEELSGILNWALEGLKRLLKNGRFTGAKSAEDIRIEYERSSDVLNAFFSERCETGIDAFVPKGEFWEAFYAYCKKYSVPNPYTGIIGFGKTVRKKYTGTTRKIDGTNTAVWVGIKLQDKEDNHENHQKRTSLKSLGKRNTLEEIKEIRGSDGGDGTIKLDDMFKKKGKQ